MRLTAVVIHSAPDQEDIEFPVKEGSPSNPYIVRQILGIDAEELIPKFYGVGAQTGGKFHDRVMRPRDIIVRIVVNPKYRANQKVTDLRDELYRLVGRNRTSQLQLQFKDGATLVSAITGLITKIEVPYFSQVPEVQLTFHCPDPTFRSIHPVDYAPEDIPTTNPIMIPDTTSTAHHGFSFKIEFTTATATFTIQDHATTPDWQFSVSPSGGFDVGDELWFSSEYSSKLVYLNGTPSMHLMDKVDSDSIWPTVFPGNNLFYFLPIANFDWLELNYFAAYWGV